MPVKTKKAQVPEGDTTAVATKPAKAKKAEPSEAKPRGRKDGLRLPQVRILKFLASNPNKTRKQIALGAPVDISSCVEYMGSMDDETRLKNDEKHFPSLISLKYIKFKKTGPEGDTDFVYEITADGKKALQAAEKEASSKSK